MKILILNWRDIKNPQSGGAEILTHELAKRLAVKNEVVWFAAKFKGAKSNEVIDRVRIIREGNPDARTLLSSVQYKAYKYYKKNLAGNLDLVIDEIHGIPFFTPLYINEKKVVLICEVAGKLWDVAVKFPFNLFGKFIENIYPSLYQNLPIITISNSSKKELSGIGFKSRAIHVLPLGCETPTVSSMPAKNNRPTLIFVGRLTKQKGIEDALLVIKKMKETMPNVLLWVIGRGDEEYVDDVKKMVSDLDLSKNIQFWGFISDKQRNTLLSKAHVLISPSAKEGWGLTVHEAGARGTPSVVYDVEGLRDVLIDGKNGLLCRENTPDEMSKLSILLLGDKKLYNKLQSGALHERKKFTWDATYEKFISSIR